MIHEPAASLFSPPTTRKKSTILSKPHTICKFSFNGVYVSNLLLCHFIWFGTLFCSYFFAKRTPSFPLSLTLPKVLSVYLASNLLFSVLFNLHMLYELVFPHTHHIPKSPRCLAFHPLHHCT